MLEAQPLRTRARQDTPVLVGRREVRILPEGCFGAAVPVDRHPLCHLLDYSVWHSVVHELVRA